MSRMEELEVKLVVAKHEWLSKAPERLLVNTGKCNQSLYNEYFEEEIRALMDVSKVHIVLSD